MTIRSSTMSDRASRATPRRRSRRSPSTSSSASARAAASCPSPSSSSSSTSSPCATRATRAATCATSSITTARRRCSYPWGEATRFKLFDLPWERAGRRRPGDAAARARSSARSTCRRRSTARSRTSCARGGQPPRPARTARTARRSRRSPQCMMAALEHYSTLDEGALYRFNWVFPSQKTMRGSLGFGHDKGGGEGADSYAHLARRRDRREAHGRGARPPALPHPDAPTGSGSSRRRTSASAATEPPNEWILRGQLSHKSQQVFEALLSSYDGSYAEVLKHVQVERYFISRRYRVGRGHHRPAAERRRGRAAGHDGPLAPVAAAVAPGGHALRGEGRAHRRRRRPPRVQRSAQAPARRLQVPAALGGDGRGRAHRAERAAQLRDDGQRQRAAPRRVPRARRVRELPRAARARARAVPAQLRAGAAHLRHARRAAGAPARRPARHRDGGARSRSSRACASPTPTATRARSAPSCRRSRAIEKADLYALGKAPERLDADSQKVLRAAIKRHLERERRVPDLRGAHRREPARDARRAARRRAVADVQVPEPGRRARRDRGALPRARTSSSGSSRTRCRAATTT